MYNVLALIPESSDFRLDGAVSHFATLVDGHPEIRAELATSEGESEPSGFRVSYGHWEVVAWLESGPDVLAFSEEVAEDDDLPAPAEVVAGCSRRLSVWSDEDESGDHSDDISDFTDALRERFGAFILDAVNGGWWT